MEKSDWTLAFAGAGMGVARGLAEKGREGKDGCRGGSFDQMVVGEGGALASCWSVMRACLASSDSLALDHICRLWSRMRLNSSSVISESVLLSSSDSTGADITML